jgi:hypothetical protein
VIAERLSGLGAIVSSSEGALLFDICVSHAFFPFPIMRNESGTPMVDEDGFVRAVCLLTLSAQRYGPKFPSATSRLYSGEWGPHNGWYIAIRGKDASDVRRRLFRSIATPDSTRVSRGTTISVPRFMWYEGEVYTEDSKREDWDGQQTIVAENESEVSMDIVDVLSECPVDHDKMIGNPYRESYRMVLPSLPERPDDLSMLSVPTAKVVALVQLAQSVLPGTTENLVATIEDLGTDGKFDWETFNSAFSDHTVSVSK